MLGFMSPRLWIMVGVGVFVAIGSFWAIHAWNGMIRSIKAEVALECKATQLEEELKFEKKRVTDLQKANEALQVLLEKREVEVEVRTVYRDRIITEIKEIQSEIVSTPEGVLIETVSPTTKAFLKAQNRDDNEE